MVQGRLDLAGRNQRITALIPAHNEEATIPATIRSLRQQMTPVDRIVVVCDNCTDHTAEVSRSLGAEIFTTAGNTRRKAGALNQALREILPQQGPGDLVLVMDADSQLNKVWLAMATDALARDQRIGAICGVFLGEPGRGLVGQVQRNEFFRYARIIQRRFQALVLSGTGTLFRVPVLRQIASERGGRLPGAYGEFYNGASITEDDEITLAVKTLGWRCLCPPACETITEVMPTWRALYRQRIRWQKGTLGDLRSYGLSKVTRSYWSRQVLLYLGFAASIACAGIMARALLGHVGVSVMWTAGILSVTILERTWTARRAGWRGMILAALVLPEMAYAMFQAWVFFSALRADLLGRDISWGHIVREATA
jgi:biofilm PGA synthesis N-glycosyltransferase PgaC